MPVSDVLKKASLFSALSSAELEALAKRTSICSLNPGETLFSEGEPCSGFYVVSSGRIRIFKTSPGGREQVLAVEGPGSSVAELPVFDGGPYPASVAAVERSQLVFISREQFRAFCLEHPEVALKVLEVVGVRLRRLVGIIEELSFTTVRQRLIAWILRRSRTQGTTFTLESSQQALAAEIGTVRELISRNLVRLQAQGFIAINGRELTIVDEPGLESELASAL